MDYLEIEKVVGREILDSRGNPNARLKRILGQAHGILR